MICIETPGFLHLQSTDGARKFTVDWHGPLFLICARLHPRRDLLAVVGSRNPYESERHGLVGYGDLRVFLADLTEGSIRQLDLDDTLEVSWSPDGNQLVYSRPGELGIYDLQDNKRRSLMRSRKNAHHFEGLAFSPDAGRIGHLRWGGDRLRLGAVDISSGENLQTRRTCFNYDWWKEDTLVYDSGSGIHLFDLNINERSLLASASRLPALRAIIEERCPWWAEIMNRERAEGELRLTQPKVIGGRLYLVVEIQAVDLGNPDDRFFCHASVASVTTDLKDAKLHSGPEPGRIGGYEIVDGEGTISIWMHNTVDEDAFSWMYAGPNAELVPEGFGPLPRTLNPQRGPVVIGSWKANWR